MRMRLEFIRRRPIPWLGLLCMSCTLTWGAILLAESITLQQVALRDEQRVEQLKLKLHAQRRAAQQLSKNDLEKQRSKKEQEKLLATLRYPWTRVLSAIEQADSNDVAILTLSHEQATGQTQITLEALDTQGLVRFVDALNEGRDGDAGTREQWYLTAYQIQTQSTPQMMRGTVLNK